MNPNDAIDGAKVVVGNELALEEAYAAPLKEHKMRVYNWKSHSCKLNLFKRYKYLLPANQISVDGQ